MSNETKAPGKILTVLLGVVVLLVIAVYLLAKLATGGFDVNAEVMTKEAVAARLKPVGEAKASDAPPGMKTGQTGLRRHLYHLSRCRPCRCAEVW